MSPKRSNDADLDHRAGPVTALPAPPPQDIRGNLSVQLAERRPFGLIVTPGKPSAALTDIPMHLARAWVRRYRVVVMRGFEFASQEPRELACRVAQWTEGASADAVRIEPVSSDSGPHTLHWIGADNHRAPEFVLFHCRSAPAPGQSHCTRFVDAGALASQLDERTYNQWLDIVLSESPSHGVRDRNVASWPLLARDPRDASPVLRYRWLAPRDCGLPREPWLLGIDEDHAAQARRFLNGILRLPTHHFVHAWQQGDVVVADNWRLLHGHDAWRHEPPGCLLRAYVSDQTY